MMLARHWYIRMYLEVLMAAFLSYISSYVLRIL